MNDVITRGQLRATVSGVIATILMIGTAFAGDVANSLELKPQVVLLKQGNLRLPVSLACPRFTVGGTEIGGGVLPIATAGDMESGKKLELSFAPIALGDSSPLEVKLYVEWSAEESVVRKWAAYRLGNSDKPKLLSDVVLEDLDTKAAGLRLLPEQPVNSDAFQSRPVFLEGFFAGIEYPVAQCRVENGRMLLSHRPGLRIKPGTWYKRASRFTESPPWARRRRASSVTSRPTARYRRAATTSSTIPTGARR